LSFVCEPFYNVYIVNAVYMHIFMTQPYNFVITDIPEKETISKPPMVDSFEANNGNFCNTFSKFSYYINFPFCVGFMS
jgi:hypothetical protein